MLPRLSNMKSGAPGSSDALSKGISDGKEIGVFCREEPVGGISEFFA